MKILTTQEAFVAMRSFLEGYYERTKSDDVGALLGDMQLLGDGLTADPRDLGRLVDLCRTIKN